MPIASFEDFKALKQDQEATFFYQELNPSDRSRPCILEIKWEHLGIEGDLVFGTMKIPQLGTLEADAYVYRSWISPEQDQPDHVFLSTVRPLMVGNELNLQSLTGGPLHTKPLRPSEISVGSDCRRDNGSAKLHRVVPFSADEHRGLCKWQQALGLKGFSASFGNETYLQYTRCAWHGLSFEFQGEGLKFSLAVRRLKTGWVGSSYFLWAHDSSFRRSSCNPRLRTACPGSTSYFLQQCSDFGGLLDLLDQAVDQVVERNEIFRS